MERDKNILGKISLVLWLVVGVAVLIEGNTTRFQYALVWGSNIINLWLLIYSEI